MRDVFCLTGDGVRFGPLCGFRHWVFLAAWAVASVLILGGGPGRAETEQALTVEEAGARLRVARQLAREMNDAGLVARVEAVATALKAGLPADAEARLREVEKAVGVDPGGWSMAGLPLYHPTREMEQAVKAAGPRLKAALAADDAEQVRAVAREIEAALGPQAGVPDGRRAGTRPGPLTLTRPEAVKLFFEALAAEGRAIRALMEGRPLPNQMARIYASVLEACVTMHPHVIELAPERLADLERLLRGTAGVLAALQQPGGHFPFPDLRGHNIRFGEMTERQVSAGAVQVRDGWIVTPDPDGGSQFDTGVCGVALLRAGALLGEQAWTAAGMRAARWAAAQKCCANFNYNAFSVSLLARAGMHDEALHKWRVGVAPGQARNGRWVDAHNARTVYHVILLRALADLGPGDAEAEAAARAATRALLDEFDAAGVTVEALPELLALTRRWPDDARLAAATRTMAATLVEKCTRATQVKMAAQPHQLAAVADLLR